MRTSILTLLVALVAVTLLVREAAPDAWALPPVQRAALAAALLAAGVALVARWRRDVAASGAAALGVAAAPGTACLLLLVAATALHLVPARPDPDVWRAREEERLRQRFDRVRTALQEIEAGAREMARDACALLTDSLATSANPEERTRKFEELDRLCARRATALWAAIGTPGVQIFDPRGELIAWAGSPHALESATRLTRLGSGTRPVYFRRSGVYTLLACEERGTPRTAPAPVETPADSTAARRGLGRLRVLVDVPVEVHYQISNRFLRSRSLDEVLSGDGVEVDLVYELPSVPSYLSQQDLELSGGELNGIRALGLVRDAEGVPLAACYLTGLSLADAEAGRTARLDHLGRWLLVGAVGLGWLAILLALRTAPLPRLRRLAATPVVPIAALWSVRVLLAGLDLPASRLAGSLLSPATFAMVGFGGVLRSPLDLLLTAIAVAATAWCVLREAARRTPHEPAPAGGGRAILGTLLGAALVGGMVHLASLFVGRVASDSNPHLIGPQLDLLSPAVACLHLGLLVGVAGWLALGVLGVGALCGAGRPRRAGLGTILETAMIFLVAAVLWRTTSPVTALAGAGALLAGLRVRVLLRDDRFTSMALAMFVLVALTATLTVEAIHWETFRARQQLVHEVARDLLDPGDDLRRFALEEVLDRARVHPELRRGLQEEGEPQQSIFAFRLWAESMLSGLGCSCEVRVTNAYGKIVSEFAVDMPPGHEVAARDLVDQARQSTAPVVETHVEPSTAGQVSYYSGAVVVRADTTLGAELLGAVVVELPFAQASLDLAANPRARTPEVLRNLQEEGIGPRADESERLLLAWLDGGFVVESSTPYLEVGKAPARASGANPWQRLRLANGTYLVSRTPAGGRELLAGFRPASPLDRVLEWTQVASFSFAVTLLALLAVLVVVRGSGAARRLPPLLVPKRVGFQQKLMLAFLAVSLLPGIVLSVATQDVMRNRAASRNRDAVLAKARAAEAALADLVRRDLDAVRESEYLRAVLEAHEAPPARDIGHLEFSQIMVLRGDGRIILDETLSNLTDEQAWDFVRRAPRGVFASRDGRNLCVGAFEKVWFSPTEGLSETAPDAAPHWVYYRRRLTDRLLRNLAPILSTDISGFLGPNLAVSSQKSLATAGLLPALVPPQAFAHVQLRRNRYAVVEEAVGRQRYFAGYLPLEDATGTRIGSLAVSQLLQPDEFAIEVERTRQLVLGLSTLMFALTLALGVFFAARIFDPVRNLIEGTRRIAGGDLGFRLRARAGDEIGELERSFNDMSERLLGARRALEERRRYLEAVLGNIASGVVATDASGCITAANPAANRILHVPPGGLEERSWSDLAAAGGGREMAHFWRRLGEAPGGEVLEIPVRGGHERLTLRVIVTDLVPDAGGAPLGRVAIFEDVTELIRSKKLSAWAEMARQVAHEIKNPLTPMKLSAQFVQQAFRDRSEKFPQIFEEGMATIVDQVESLRRIATQFSNFGRVQKLQPRPLDLGELLRSVVAAYRGIDGLELEFAEHEVNGVRVLGDDDGLRRVFRNILENAREAMGGTGRITVRVERIAPEHVQVRIADRGPGISDDTVGRLFEPYFSTKTTGTGLGLAISRSIVEELGGSIVLANRPEGGAEARVTLALC